jgi:AhpD family alkylhydroperoxidase
MTQRIAYAQQSPELFKKYREFSTALREAGIDQQIYDLVDIRASQLNGCAFCLDMHVKEAKLHGERELRLHHVSIWRESPLFSERERAALAWTEALTKISETHAPDADYDALKAQFSDVEIVNLTALIAAINAWNRVAIGLRAQHPHDKAVAQKAA